LGVLNTDTYLLQKDWRLKTKPSNGAFAIAIGYINTPVEGGSRANGLPET